jgi:hypothetical protein
MVRFINLVLTALGMAVSAALLFYAVLLPQNFDGRVRDFAIAEVQDRVTGLINMLPGDSVTEFGGVLGQGLQERMDALRAEIATEHREMTRHILAGLMGDAEARDLARAIYDDTLARYGVAFERLESMTLERYHEVLGQLRRDVTIFCSLNLLAFTAAFTLALFMPAASKELLPLSLVLTATIILSILWYVLGQDWVMTIIFSNYWGWSYATAMMVIFALLADIALNRARVIRIIGDYVGSLIGAAS